MSIDPHRTTLPPEVESILLALSNRYHDDNDSLTVYEALYSAYRLGLSAGRVQGLEEAAEYMMGAGFRSNGTPAYEHHAASIRALARDLGGGE